jgi:hypothetical protein
LLQFITHIPTRQWHNSVSRESAGHGLPIMQRLADKPTAAANKPFLARTAEDERELTLLAQFMRHDSVASLAKAIAAGSRGRLQAKDLIAAAGLAPPASDN